MTSLAIKHGDKKLMPIRYVNIFTKIINFFMQNQRLNTFFLN